MIHVFLSGDIIKVNDISFISKIFKESNFSFREHVYFYEVVLNNNTKIKQTIIYRLCKYSDEFNKQEEIVYHFGDYRLQEKEVINLKSTRSMGYVLPEFDENINCFKEFKENYRDLINKFEKINGI